MNQQTDDEYYNDIDYITTFPEICFWLNNKVKNNYSNFGCKNYCERKKCECGLKKSWNLKTEQKHN